MPPVPGMHVMWPKTFSAGADEDSVILGTAASVNLGINVDSQDNVGKPVSVCNQPGERPFWQSGAAVAIDTRLASDATGRAVAATTGQSYTAISRQAATAADQLIVVELVSAGLTAP